MLFVVFNCLEVLASQSNDQNQCEIDMKGKFSCPKEKNCVVKLAFTDDSKHESFPETYNKTNYYRPSNRTFEDVSRDSPNTSSDVPKEDTIEIKERKSGKGNLNVDFKYTKKKPIRRSHNKNSNEYEEESSFGTFSISTDFVYVKKGPKENPKMKNEIEIKQQHSGKGNFSVDFDYTKEKNKKNPNYSKVPMEGALGNVSLVGEFKYTEEGLKDEQRSAKDEQKPSKDEERPLSDPPCNPPRDEQGSSFNYSYDVVDDCDENTSSSSLTNVSDIDFESRDVLSASSQPKECEEKCLKENVKEILSHSKEMTEDEKIALYFSILKNVSDLKTSEGESKADVDEKMINDELKKTIIFEKVANGIKNVISTLFLYESSEEESRPSSPVEKEYRVPTKSDIKDYVEDHPEEESYNRQMKMRIDFPEESSLEKKDVDNVKFAEEREVSDSSEDLYLESLEEPMILTKESEDISKESKIMA
ncbi:hypothetical protein NGRA_1909 [Nosema granulosis]|uniref:Uncharacterized protein n=1 Tax=Nosema granulosis TaxID=83296 RepID=A0A9P6GYM7_9MICR|nr:hypothetical protein NGRA_1909 [Nosema granulosis]